jgi:hypothetical protein
MIVTGRNADMKADHPQPVSKLIPGSGHAILATDGPGKLTAAITFGPYGGFHGHFDKLSFVFFGYGQEIGVDPGRSASQAYRLPVHREWYKATTGHNAVLVDGRSQKEACGSLMAYTASISYTAVSADAGPAFDSLTHRRFLLLGPTYLLVVDELKASDDKEHTFDWLYHNKSQGTLCDLTATSAGPGDFPPGYSYLKDIRSFKTANEKQIEVKFMNDQVTTRVMMIANPGDEVFTASGPLASVLDRAPAMIVRRKGKVIHFIVVIEPFLSQKLPDIRGLEIMKGSSLSVRVIRTGGEDLISFEDESLANFTVSNKSGSSGQSLVLKASPGSR